MLNSRVAQFHSLVWSAAARFGRNAPLVANEIIRKAFPRTAAEAELEGADKMLRVGVIAEVKEILRAGDSADEKQSDFSEIDDEFQPIVKKLKSKSYYVEGIGEYVAIPGLIRNPEYLDDARQFMRRKGLETLAEAKLLDELYAAVSSAA